MQVIEVGPDSERTGAAINRAVGEALQSCSLRQVRCSLLAPAKWQSCACAACLGCTAQTAIQLVRQPEPILMAFLGSACNAQAQPPAVPVPGLQCCTLVH